MSLVSFITWGYPNKGGAPCFMFVSISLFLSQQNFLNLLCMSTSNLSLFKIKPWLASCNWSSLNNFDLFNFGIPGRVPLYWYIFLINSYSTESMLALVFKLIGESSLLSSFNAIIVFLESTLSYFCFIYLIIQLFHQSDFKPRCNFTTIHLAMI